MQRNNDNHGTYRFNGFFVSHRLNDIPSLKLVVSSYTSCSLVNSLTITATSDHNLVIQE